MAGEPEENFDRVFSQYGAIASFAVRRGSRDPESIAAETMAIAWRRLAEIDHDDCRPWLFTTARNLLMAEQRRTREEPFDASALELPDASIPDFPIESLDPDIDRALAALDPLDREALLLVAWDELNPREAAASLGIKPNAFRVRLHRARKRFHAHFEAKPRSLPMPSEEQT
ncbi:MAG: sigma-70 family RNA polymerase sigma factor [Solirubrobacterales bacterium]